MKRLDERKSLASLIASMLIFGTVGIFSKYIPLPSGVIAFGRSLIGTLFILMFILVSGKRPSGEAIKRNLKWLVPSGVCLGGNWILFFLACKTTSIPTATLSYYLAPAILVISSAFVFRERIGLKHIASITLSVIGMALASGVLVGGVEGVSAKGILFGLMAAVLYAAVVTFNKLMRDISATDKTLMQFAVSSLVLLPYILIFDGALELRAEGGAFLCLLLLGVIHTGVAYVLYFGAAGRLKSVTVAILSYIDPVVSILVSVIFFDERLGAFGVVGATLIAGSAILCEIDFPKTEKHRKNINLPENVNNSEE